MRIASLKQEEHRYIFQNLISFATLKQNKYNNTLFWQCLVKKEDIF